MMKILEPGWIGKLATKNRIIMAAMGNGLIEPDGSLSQRGIDYYVDRAKGGVGLIITCAARTRLIEQLPSTPFVRQMVIDSKRCVSRLNELAEAVHDYGAKVAVQVVPGQGRNIGSEILKSAGAVAPSPLPAFADDSIMARELSIEEIRQLVKAFQFMAEVIRDAGIDAIEINAHAGYLCDQFMTPLWNRRTDEYGGNLENRLRFLLEIVRNVKEGAGSDFPIIVKYALTHYLDGGRDIEEGLEIARRLEAAGVDALDIDAGCYETEYWTVPPTTQSPGCMAHLAEKVKKVVAIPVIAVGKLQYPQLAEELLRESKADFIALGRAFLADSEWANKVKEGKLEDICPCVGDNECHRRIFAGKFISCTVNTRCGMEKELSISLTDTKKTVLVVGGGPSGLESARVSALRGHKVTLCEKGNTLGGNLIPASASDFKEDYRHLINYLSNRVKKLGVEIKLETEVTRELVLEMRPDVVFIAAGAKEIIPEIPGVNKAKVSTAIDVLSGKKETGELVIVVGGGIVGCETGLHIAQRGKRVTIVEMLDVLASDMYSINRTHLLKLLSDANVHILTGVTVLEIIDSGVAITDKAGKKRRLKAETVVLAVGFKPDDKLLKALKDTVPELYAIGDCIAPRDVAHAIREAYRAARLI